MKKLLLITSTLIGVICLGSGHLQSQTNLQVDGSGKPTTTLDLDSPNVLFPYVDTMDKLRKLPLPAGPTYVELLGYYSASDGGGGRFRWDAASTADDNNGTVIQRLRLAATQPPSPAPPVYEPVPGNGRWLRQCNPHELSVAWFGAIPGQDAATQTLRIQAAHDALAVPGAQMLEKSPTHPYCAGTLNIPPGRYTINDTLYFAAAVRVQGSPVNITYILLAAGSPGFGNANTEKWMVYCDHPAGVGPSNVFAGGVYNLNIDCQGYVSGAPTTSNYGASGIWYQGAQLCEIDHLWVSNPGLRGVVFCGARIAHVECYGILDPTNAVTSRGPGITITGGSVNILNGDSLWVEHFNVQHIIDTENDSYGDEYPSILIKGMVGVQLHEIEGERGLGYSAGSVTLGASTYCKIEDSAEVDLDTFSVGLYYKAVLIRGYTHGINISHINVGGNPAESLPILVDDEGYGDGGRGTDHPNIVANAVGGPPSIGTSSSLGNYETQNYVVQSRVDSLSVGTVSSPVQAGGYLAGRSLGSTALSLAPLFYNTVPAHTSLALRGDGVVSDTEFSNRINLYYNEDGGQPAYHAVRFTPGGHWQQVFGHLSTEDVVIADNGVTLKTGPLFMGTNQIADLSGNLTGQTVTAALFSGSGASLTSLNANNIASGTVPIDRLPTGTGSSATTIPLNNDSRLTLASTAVQPGTAPTLTGTNFINIPESAVVNLAADLAAKVPAARNIATGTGLSGGGDLSADRTLAVNFGTATGTVAQGNDSRFSTIAVGAAGSSTGGGAGGAAGILGTTINNISGAGGNSTGTGAGGAGGTISPSTAFISVATGNGGATAGPGNGGAAGSLSSSGLLIYTGSGGAGGSVAGANGGVGGAVSSNFIIRGGNGGAGGISSGANGGAGGALTQPSKISGGIGGNAASVSGGAGGVAGALNLVGGNGGNGGSADSAIGGVGGDGGKITLNGGNGSSNGMAGGSAGSIDLSGSPATSTIPGVPGGMINLVGGAGTITLGGGTTLTMPPVTGTLALAHNGTPSIAAGSVGGTGGSIVFAGSPAPAAGDTGMTIVLTTGSSGVASGTTLATVTYGSAFATASYAAVSPANLNAGALGTLPYVTVTSTGFTLNASAAIPASKIYTWNVVVSGR